MTSSLFHRIRFALKHRTLRRVVVVTGKPDKILVFHRGNITELPRRCPHQGAPLETGYLENGDWRCPWHGCKFRLGVTFPVDGSKPTRE